MTHIQYQTDHDLITGGVEKLEKFFDNGQWPGTLANGRIVANLSMDRWDRSNACFRIIEDIEQCRYQATGPEDVEEAHQLAEHFREIRTRIRRL